jgi:hypothetical protein
MKTLRHWKEKCYKKYIIIQHNEGKSIKVKFNFPQETRKFGNNSNIKETFIKTCLGALQEPLNFYLRVLEAKSDLEKRFESTQEANNYCRNDE